MKVHSLIAAALLLAACSSPAPSTGPDDPVAGAQCELDGMTLADYPGPKGQIHYAGGEVSWFCDNVELLSMLLAPEQVRRIDGAYTQDMGATDWDAPQGHWIPVEHAFFVEGSSRVGSMGPTLASFAARGAAEAFVGSYGGRVLAYSEITPDMVLLHSGTHHDHGM